MRFILIILLTYIACQILKYLFRFFSKQPNLNKKITWTFIWATGAPSAHSATLSSGLYLLYKDIGMSSLFVLCLLVAIIFTYNLIADREREKIREEFLIKGDEFDKKIVLTGRVMDISGHTFVDIISGVIVGIVSTYIFILLL